MHLRTIIFLMIDMSCCLCAVQSTYDNLYTYILSGYNKNVLPIVNNGDIVNVSVSVYAVSINDFDQLSGQLSMTTLFELDWYERRVFWNVSDYNNISSILINSNRIWYPIINIQETSTSVDSIVSKSEVARINNEGHVALIFGIIVKITCSLDVTYFPFDYQICFVTLAGTRYSESELQLNGHTNELNTNYFSPNSQWELLPSYVYNKSNLRIRYEIGLKRRTAFYVVYIIIPILLLGVINNLVFVLPTSSGERMSVAITIFLSFVVYMDIVNNNVPESSSPVSYLYVYLLFLMFYSATTMVLTIISMRIHNKESKVPSNIQIWIQHLRFWCLKHAAKSLVYPEGDTNVYQEDVTMTKSDLPKDELRQSGSDNYKQEIPIVTWVSVSETFDIYCFVVMFMTFLIYTIVTFTKLTSNSGL